MYEVEVTYLNEENVDTLLCSSKPSAEFAGDYVILNCGNGQQFTLNIAKMLKVAIKYPIPDNFPSFRYAVDIHYNENVDLLFSHNSFDVDVKSNVVVVKEGDNVVRIINPEQLRSVKVSAYSEHKHGKPS
jgi:hypothetical protein